MLRHRLQAFEETESKGQRYVGSTERTYVQRSVGRKTINFTNRKKNSRTVAAPGL
jgi:hypothetical protein